MFSLQGLMLYFIFLIKFETQHLSIEEVKVIIREKYCFEEIAL